MGLTSLEGQEGTEGYDGSLYNEHKWLDSIGCGGLAVGNGNTGLHV